MFLSKKSVNFFGTCSRTSLHEGRGDARALRPIIAHVDALWNALHCRSSGPRNVSTEINLRAAQRELAFLHY